MAVDLSSRQSFSLLVAISLGVIKYEIKKRERVGFWASKIPFDREYKSKTVTQSITCQLELNISPMRAF